MENKNRICVVNYKTGWISSNLCYGTAFDSIAECCRVFLDGFFGRGNKKSTIFGDGSLYKTTRGGIDLVIQGGELKVLLAGEPINYCPWCGSKIEVRQSKKVLLVPKTETIRVGFIEKPMGKSVVAS